MRIWWTLALGLAACDGPLDPDDDGVPEDAVRFTDAHNYAFTGSISITEAEVAAGADSTIDWCSLTTDLRGRAVPDPSAVDQVLLVEFALTQQEIMQKVETNALKQSDSATQWLLIDPDGCAAQMSAFEIIGNYFDPAEHMVERPDRTWLASIMNTPDGRFDILMSRFVVPKGASDDTVVTVDDDAATLSFQADLQSAEPLVVEAGEVPWLDWSGATVDVNGAPYDPLYGNRLLLGKVAVDTVAEAEALFLRLDEEAEALYYLDVYAATSANLALAKTRAGQAFGGFTTDGVWLVGIECLSCTSPAPLLLSVVEVR